jgi:hypothetical protein
LQVSFPKATRGLEPISYRGALVSTPLHATKTKKNCTPLPESASELYRPNDRRLSAKIVPTFTDRRCHVVSVTDSYGRILGFLDRFYMTQYVFLHNFLNLLAQIEHRMRLHKRKKNVFLRYLTTFPSSISVQRRLMEW